MLFTSLLVACNHDGYYVVHPHIDTRPRPIQNKGRNTSPHSDLASDIITSSYLIGYMVLLWSKVRVRATIYLPSFWGRIVLPRGEIVWNSSKRIVNTTSKMNISPFLAGSPRRMVKDQAVTVQPKFQWCELTFFGWYTVFWLCGERGPISFADVPLQLPLLGC